MRISHSIEIDAPVTRVWNLTLDVEAWPEFVPTMTRAEWVTEAPIRVGSQARIKQPAQRAKLWTVSILEPESCFAWTTSSPGSTMTATHRLVAAGSRTTNTLTIEMRGWLAPLFGTLFRRLVASALASENEAFRRVAQDSSRG